jgi:hypothetical protein
VAVLVECPRLARLFWLALNEWLDNLFSDVNCQYWG